MSLDGSWSFIPDPDHALDAAALPAGVPITVPGCWEAQIEAPYGIVTAWYRRSLEVPAEWRGGRISVRFGAVMYASEVFLNGRQIGTHEGGYTPFEVSIRHEDLASGRNDLALRVTNPLNAIADYPVFPEADVRAYEARFPDLPLGEIPHGKQTWYTSQSGIWQSVTLEHRPRLSLEPLRVRPDVPGGRALVSWAIAPGDERPEAGSRISFTAIAPDGATAGGADVDPGAGGSGEPVDAGAATRPGARHEVAIPLDTVSLWDVDAPNLYRMVARLVGPGGDVIDEVVARFGMREIRTEGGRILLNGRPVYVRGALDQDLYPGTISSPPSREFLDDQMRRVREMGINLLRVHIKVPDPAYLDAADEAGILLWCELPNWLRFTRRAAERGRETLRAMVEVMGNHPSVVIWTIINEDWGTRVRYEARDRAWLRQTHAWLKGLDPSRLVVDNSACDATFGPNFHVRSDLADFHVYHQVPDHAHRWRQRMEEFSRRPAWLWSPHGDADQRGDEPLILSEFGGWGLPRPDRTLDSGGGEPWWFETGRHHFRPAGLVDRFAAQGLNRIWPSIDDLAEATQWNQYETLHYEIGELRRHDSIQGYVVTELSDANWEPNGLLDESRGRKVFHEQLADLNADDVVVADLPARALAAGGSMAAAVHLSSYGSPVADGAIQWRFQLGERLLSSGVLPVDSWPGGGVRSVGVIELAGPDVDVTVDAVLQLTAVDGSGGRRASNSYRLAVVPASNGHGGPLEVRALDPSGIWGVPGRVERIGHRLASLASADVIVTTELDRDLVDWVDSGGRLLLLARSRDAIPSGIRLDRTIAVHPRNLAHPDWPGDRSPWDGDWVTTWSWLRRDALPGLPDRNPLDLAFEEVMPDHVLTGARPEDIDEVAAGMFAGWIHAPAAIVWRFPQGRGFITATTFRVAPEAGPVAALLLDRLLRQAAGEVSGPGERPVAGDAAIPATGARPPGEAAQVTR